jgi:predicted transcriptional regulator
MVVSTEWVNEHQKVVTVAKDTEENRQKGAGDLLMENKHLLLDEVLKNNPKLTMTDALITDQEIAILCDVLEGWGANLNTDKRKVLDQFIAKGFVVLTDQESPAKYKITDKAQQLLAERGVGLSGG